MKASVLVVGYKQAKIMPYLLKAYDLQSVKDFEIIYVENGVGEDETGIRILKETKISVPIREIVNFKNETPGTCWNMAALQAKGELLILTHGDVIPDKYLVESYLRGNDDNHILAGLSHHIDPAKLFAKNVTAALSCYEEKWRWHPLSGMVWRLDILSRFMDDIMPTTTPRALSGRPYYFVSGSNMAIPKKIFQQVKGCDSALRGHAPMDWDLALKAWADGYEVKHIPGAITFRVEDPEQASLRDEQKSVSLKAFLQRERTILGRL